MYKPRIKADVLLRLSETDCSLFVTHRKSLLSGILLLHASPVRLLLVLQRSQAAMKL